MEEFGKGRFWATALALISLVAFIAWGYWAETANQAREERRAQQSGELKTVQIAAMEGLRLADVTKNAGSAKSPSYYTERDWAYFDADDVRVINGAQATNVVCPSLELMGREYQPKFTVTSAQLENWASVLTKKSVVAQVRMLYKQQTTTLERCPWLNVDEQGHLLMSGHRLALLLSLDVKE